LLEKEADQAEIKARKQAQEDTTEVVPNSPGRPSTPPGNIQLTEPYAVRQVELRRRRATEETTSEGKDSFIDVKSSEWTLIPSRRDLAGAALDTGTLFIDETEG
jgi:hypothetical protein